MTQLKRLAVLPVLLSFACVLLVSSAAAQTTGSLEATATVTGGREPLTVTWQNDLDFGTVTAGAGPVTPSEASWGRFMVTGEPTTLISVEYTTLPTQLDDGLGNSIAISFAATDGILWGDTYTPGTYATFNPYVSQSFTLSAADPGEMYVGIRGTVDPPATAVNGDYTGTVVLTVAYP